MGEFTVSSEDAMEVVLQEEEGEGETQEDKKKDSSATMVKWEEIFPRMFLRVLLVEADDSTRQIIAALLRKCSYRVSAVPDGLKAWEALKGRPHKIDLILTEVELPLISGFALLTLIMEHEICKNIPVIMMSSHDSISMVFKCMLRGAADFLIKPIRKNELRNLWQHVWRRQTSTGSGHGHQEGRPVQQKVEAISENNAASNHSSDYVARTQKNKQCSEKGSDTQSSCTKPDRQAENAYIQNMQDQLQPKRRSASPVSDSHIQKHGGCIDQNLLVHENRTEGKDQDYVRMITHSDDVAPETQSEDVYINTKTQSGYHEKVPLREAIDLIGAFDNHRSYDNTYRTVQEVVSCDTKIKSGLDDDQLGPTPLLELSLRRSYTIDPEKQRTDIRHALNHSNFSAFSWYNNRVMQQCVPLSASCATEQSERSINSDKQLSRQDNAKTSDASQQNGISSNNNHESMTSLVRQSGPSETVFRCSPLGVVHMPVSVRSMTFDDLRSSYGALIPPIFYTQSSPIPVWGQSSPVNQWELTVPLNSSLHSNPETCNSRQGYHPHSQNENYANKHKVHELEEHNMESAEHPGDVSPATGNSASSSLCNGAVSHLNSSGCGSICNGSNGNVTPAAAGRTTTESETDECIFIHDGIRGINSHRSTEREAALTKFRLKRKERCYEKKVRYQSRKKLAEQRPRVKGQFVRQMPMQPSIC
ncbi:PREDICTED: two-component response regulator-like PRR95 [Nelumbo nucifera]|uniref:Two-component response regulator-like PRR95 n=1 Tax=Nelumbo nucifera TaxID=4432 RepID=A0A1U7ZIS1_NELNU|nr:PREDICTED: two-component response regulator-like PRR95 [Nelumbo nucifera]